MTATATATGSVPMPQAAPPIGLTDSVPNNSGRTRDSTSKRRRFLLAALPMALINVLLGLTIFNWISMTDWGASQRLDCDPNGKLWTSVFIDGGLSLGKNAWQSRYLLAITAGWGELDFATAKGIDVAWDWIVGRGWQAVSTWIVYQVFRSHWTMNLERVHRTMPAQGVIALQYSTVTLGGLWTYLRLLFRPSALRPLRKTTLVLILCVIYVLLAPTWLSTMTGYVANSTPTISLDGVTFVDSSRITTCEFMLVDGDRIGMSRNTCLSSLQERPGLYEYYYRYVAQYDDRTGNERSNVSSIFTGDDRTYHLDAPLLTFDKPDMTMSYNGQIFNKTVIERSGVCQPSNTYRWGFSQQLTFVFLITTTVLGTFLLGIWYLTLSRDGGDVAADMVFGKLKTAMVASEALFEVVGGGAKAMSDTQLEAALQAHRTAMRTILDDDGEEYALTTEELEEALRAHRVEMRTKRRGGGAKYAPDTELEQLAPTPLASRSRLGRTLTDSRRSGEAAPGRSGEEGY